jgi:hypothetical protein
MMLQLMQSNNRQQVPVDVVWQAVLGVTYQYSAGNITEDVYSGYCADLKVRLCSVVFYYVFNRCFLEKGSLLCVYLLIVSRIFQVHFGTNLRASNERNTYAVRAGEDGNLAGGGGNNVLNADGGGDDAAAAATAGVAAAAAQGNGELIMVQGSDNGHVEEAAEYRFFLYRHWSLFDAMYHSPYVAAKLNVWSNQGTVKLQELFAQIGVPLQQVRQLYQYMAPALRSHFSQQINDRHILETYGLTNPTVTFKVKNCCIVPEVVTFF